MKKLSLIPIAALAFSFLVATPSADAQTVTSGTVPMFYSQPGATTPVNSGNTTALPAGTYYLQSGQPIYYYGNGTYYDSATQTYGGSTNDPYGTSGTYTATTLAIPSAPGTGFDGGATSTSVNWLILTLSGIACVGSLVYATRSSAQA